MIYYSCNKWLNLFQAVNSHLLFTYNILKQYIEIFHQISIIMLYTSIRHSLNINILVIKKVFKDKAIEKYFFISYDNIQFYKKAYN